MLWVYKCWGIIGLKLQFLSGHWLNCLNTDEFRPLGPLKVLDLDYRVSSLYINGSISSKDGNIYNIKIRTQEKLMSPYWFLVYAQHVVTNPDRLYLKRSLKRLHWLHTTLQRQPLKSLFLSQITVGSSVSPPPLLSAFALIPSTHNSGISLSLSHSSSPSPPSVPAHPSAERRIVCMNKQEIREMSSFSSLFCPLFCGSWPSPSKMLMCFSCTTAFPVFSLCCHSSLPFLNNCVPLSAGL